MGQQSIGIHQKNTQHKVRDHSINNRKIPNFALVCPKGVSINTCTHWIKKEEKLAHSGADVEGIE